MARKIYTSEQLLGYLREAEVLLSKGIKVPKICRKIGIAEPKAESGVAPAYLFDPTAVTGQ